jgi:hypothetical protein
MKVNIYFEIFNILNEYELLLNIYHNKKFMIDEKNKKNNDDNNKKNQEKINIDKNLNEFMDNDFLNYIFNSVKIKKNDIPNNLNQTHNEDNKLNDDIPNNLNQTHNTQSNEDAKLIEDAKSNEKKNNNEITNFIKKYYRKIVILTHPDKTNDIIKNNIFKKAKDNIENNFLIGIIKNCYDLKIEINDLTESLLNHIMFEIRVIQEKIIELRKIINI